MTLSKGDSPSFTDCPPLSKFTLDFTSNPWPLFDCESILLMITWSLPPAPTPLRNSYCEQPPTCNQCITYRKKKELPLTPNWSIENEWEIATDFHLNSAQSQRVQKAYPLILLEQAYCNYISCSRVSYRLQYIIWGRSKIIWRPILSMKEGLARGSDADM